MHGPNHNGLVNFVFLVVAPEQGTRPEQRCLFVIFPPLLPLHCRPSQTVIHAKAHTIDASPASPLLKPPPLTPRGLTAHLASRARLSYGRSTPLLSLRSEQDVGTEARRLLKWHLPHGASCTGDSRKDLMACPKARAAPSRVSVDSAKASHLNDDITPGN